MKKVKLAIIGCGRVAGHHCNMIRDIDELELMAVCDLNEVRAQELADANHVPYYLNYHQMLKELEVDVVSIITPSGMHAYHALDVIERYKKHVIIEKPFVMNLDDAKKLRAVADTNNVKIFSIYQNRFNKAVQRVRRAIDEGELGKPVMGSVRLHWCRPQAYYDRDPWRGTWAMDGGALTNQGIHYIDLLQWLMGDVDMVYANKATQLVDVEVEDMVTGCIKFKSNALGTIEITTAARPKDFEASVTVIGDKGSAVIAGVATNDLLEFTPMPEDCAACSEEFPTVYGFGHRHLLQSVAKDLLGSEGYSIPIGDALNAVQLLNAIYVSTEEGRPVNMSESPKSAVLGRYDRALVELYTTNPE